MDSDVESSFMLMRMLAGPATAFLGFFVSLMATAPLVIYLVARWRSHRDPAPDSQLGLKFAIHYFAMIAFQLAAGGIAFLLYTVLSDESHKGSMERAALGLIVPSALVLAGSLALLARTNDRLVPGVRRLFLGYNLLTTGIIGFVGLVMASEVLFAKGSADGLGQVAAAIVIVYCGAWAGLAAVFGNLVLGGGGSAVPPMAMPVMPPAPMPLHRD